MVHPPADASVEIVDIIRILAHALSLGIRDFSDIHTVAYRSLHHDVKGGNVGVIGQVGADAKGNPGPALKVLIDTVGMF